MKRISLTFLVILSILVALPLRAQNKRVEKKILASVDATNDEMLALLEELVNINSGTMNLAGVKQVGDILLEKFDALGMETAWLDGSSFNRAGHLYAEQKGKAGTPTFLLIGHLDTVFEPSSPFQTFKMVDDKIASGPGVDDMKGGDVVILQALTALKDAGVLKDMNIIVVMTGDEELSGRPLELSKKALAEGAERADIALGFENGDGNPQTAVVARRGSVGWELTTKGNPAHSSQVFSEKVGAGAIYEMARVLNSFYEELSTEELLTFNPGVVLGGTTVDHDQANDQGTAFGKSNVVAETAIATGDIRAITLDQLDKTFETMTRITTENRPLTTAEITFGEGYPPFAPTDGNYQLLGYFSTVSEELGFGEVTAVNPRNAGAADISFTAGLVDMAIDGMGLAGTNDHTVNETADLSSLPVQSKRAAILMYRLATGVYE